MACWENTEDLPLLSHFIHSIIILLYTSYSNSFPGFKNTFLFLSYYTAFPKHSPKIKAGVKKVFHVACASGPGNFSSAYIGASSVVFRVVPVSKHQSQGADTPPERRVMLPAGNSLQPNTARIKGTGKHH